MESSLGEPLEMALEFEGAKSRNCFPVPSSPDLRGDGYGDC